MAAMATKCRPRISSTCSLEVEDVCTPWSFCVPLVHFSLLCVVFASNSSSSIAPLSCIFSLPISTVWWSPRTSIGTGTASASTAAAILSPTAAATTAAGGRRHRNLGQQPGQSNPAAASDPAAAHLSDLRTLWFGLFFLTAIQLCHNRLFTPPRTLVYFGAPHDLPPCTLLRERGAVHEHLLPGRGADPRRTAAQCA